MSLPCGKSEVTTPKSAITQASCPWTFIIFPRSNFFISEINGSINSSKLPPNGTNPRTKWFLINFFDEQACFQTANIHLLMNGKHFDMYQNHRSKDLKITCKPSWKEMVVTLI